LIKAYIKYPENFIIFSTANPFPSIQQSDEDSE